LIIGPVTVGALYDGLGREAAFLSVAGLLTVVGLMALRLLPETRGRNMTAYLEQGPGGAQTLQVISHDGGRHATNDCANKVCP